MKLNKLKFKFTKSGLLFYCKESPKKSISQSEILKVHEAPKRNCEIIQIVIDLDME